MAASTASAPRKSEPPLFPFPSLAGLPVHEALRLIRTPNVGPITFFHLLRRYGTPARALEHLPELARRGGKPLMPVPPEAVAKEMDAAARFGARFLLYGEPEYPAALLHLPDPPPVLTLTGDAALLNASQSLGVVGARNASANGCALTQRLAQELGAAGVIVVSGLARGIDAFAHKGALVTGTVAVIAGGIDTLYPPENKELYARIRAQGVIVSEQAFGMQPFNSSFPSRNRIIAGLTPGTLVVEAALKSGSLITAARALDYGRDVFAVPGSPLDPRARGCNALIKQGAMLVETSEDILQALNTPRGVGEPFLEPYTPPSNEPDEATLQEARRILQEKLGPTPVSIDLLIAQSGMPVGAALTVLLELELAGKLTRVAGNQVCLSGFSA